MILAHEQDDTERYFFFLSRSKWCKQKSIRISIYLFTASFVYKNTRAKYSYKYYKMTMSNILTSDDLNNEFFQIFAF